MPTYDYRCTKCRKRFAVEQSIRDKPLSKCRTCGAKLEKMLPKSVNLIFKGPGFYVTDYRKGGAGASKGLGRHGADDDGPEGKGKTSGGAKASGSSKTSGRRGASGRGGSV
jgi:putative FmdB family regulatory protein